MSEMLTFNGIYNISECCAYVYLSNATVGGVNILNECRHYVKRATLTLALCPSLAPAHCGLTYGAVRVSLWATTFNVYINCKLID